MTHRTLRGITVLAVSATLALAGCSSGGGSGSDSPSASSSASASTGSTKSTASAKDVATLKDVKVTGKVGAEPTVTFKTPLSVDAATVVLDTAGTGADIKDGETLSMNYVAYAGDTGEKQDSSYGKSPQALVMDDQVTITEITSFLRGQKVGVRFVVGIPPTSADTPTNVLVCEIESAKTLPTRAEGEKVTPPAGLPTVTLADNGEPSIDIPKDYKAPDKLVAQTLIKGSGPEVKADQTVTANYTGWLLNGTSFDSSWKNGQAASFPLDGVIAGWKQGLTGQTVGSQVLLVIPPELAYKDQETSSIPANSTLVFVVDILDAQ